MLYEEQRIFDIGKGDKNPSPIEPIYLREGENDGTKIIGRIYDDAKPLNVKGYSVVFKLTNPAKMYVDVPGTIENAEDGTVSVIVNHDMTDYRGTIQTAYFELSKGEEIVTTNDVAIKVLASNDLSDDQRRKYETTIDKLVQRLEALTKEFKDVSNIVVTYKAGASGTSAPSGTYTAAIPTVGQGEYLWAKIQVNYSNDTNQIFYMCTRQGRDNTTWGVATPSTDGLMSAADKSMLERGVPKLLGSLTIIDSGSADDLKTAGTYRVDRAVTGTPMQNTLFVIDVQNANGGGGSYLRQVATTHDTDREFIRKYNPIAETWSEWVETYRFTGVKPIEAGGTGADTLQGAKQNLGITKIENNRPEWLGTATSITEGDLDDIRTPGVYRIPAGLGHHPTNSTMRMVVYYASGTTSDYTRQIATSYTESGEEYIRTYNLGTWSSWRKTYGNTTIRPVEGGGTGATNAADARENLGLGEAYLMGNAPNKNIIREGDLNDIKTPGIYGISSMYVNSIDNIPIKSSGRLYVEYSNNGGGNYIRQTYITASGSVAYYIRTFEDQQGWKEWTQTVDMLSATRATNLMWEFIKEKIEATYNVTKK